MFLRQNFDRSKARFAILALSYESQPGLYASVDTQVPEPVDLSIASRIFWFRAPNSKSGKLFSSRPIAWTRSYTSNTFISKYPSPPPAKSNPKKAEYCGTCDPQ